MRERARALDRPPSHRQLQTVVVVGLAFFISALFFVRIPEAGDRIAAVGLALQTLAGLLASARLWANGAADAAVSWLARQIGRGRSRGLGLLDGRVVSLALAGCFYVVANLMAKALWALTPMGPLGFFVAVPALLLLAAGAALFMLAMCMFAGAVLSPTNPLPDGKALTGAKVRMAARKWVWPAIGLAIVVGGLLQT
jgi:hypothetical protein